MKKILIPLLVLVMLCVSLAALAEGGEEALTLELNTARLPFYAADDPYLNGFTAEGNTLPVIVIFVKKGVNLQVTVTPRTVKNKKVTLSVDNEEVVQVKGNGVYGLKPGEAVLTIASQEDPSVTLQYRIAVIQPVTRLTLTAPEKVATVAAGSTLQLTPNFLPEDATRKQVTWTSQAEQFATVDENGVVTGVARGNARILATVNDGSNIRANITVRVTQSAQEITLDKTELTVDVKRNAVVRATVMPKNADNKKVIWTSSDESVATVNAQGRITGVALGDCEITCTSQDVATVMAKVTVHVQQPVQKVTFDDAPAVYNGETAQLTWHIEPENASNPKLAFKSNDERIATVDENGVITGVAGGDVYINAVTTDGSNRQARVKVKVYQHLTGVHMLRKTAYIDLGEMSVAGAILEPEKAKNINPNMTWESSDPSIVTVKANAKQPNRAEITGVAYGDAYVTGTTEDGGYQTSILVRIGDWENSLKIVSAGIGYDECPYFDVKNVSDLDISNIKVECECYDWDGNPAIGVNGKDSNIVRYVYKKHVGPGGVTNENGWSVVGTYDKNVGIGSMIVRVTEFTIDNDWDKVIRKQFRPKYKYRR